ncbi:leucine-rich repeat domain-containing protein [Candidatus Dependentiae bacterium]|nr:leucine-rich repeat domain-containing protein [Candidatus Dependentiae bacterium]
MYKKISLVFLLSGSIFSMYGMKKVGSLVDLSRAVVAKQVINESLDEGLLDGWRKPYFFKIPEEKAEGVIQKLASLPKLIRIPLLKEVGRILRLKDKTVLNLGVDYGFSIQELFRTFSHRCHFSVHSYGSNNSERYHTLGGMEGFKLYLRLFGSENYEISSDQLDKMKSYEMDLSQLGINNLNGIEILHAGIESSQCKFIRFTIPKFTIKYIEKLEHLYIRNNSISEIGNHLFLNFNTLKSLDLSGNQISVVKLHSLNGLGNLEYLSLASNELTNFDPKILQYTQKLKKINLRNNYLDNTEELKKTIKAEFPYEHMININLKYQKESSKKEKKEGEEGLTKKV